MKIAELFAEFRASGFERLSAQMSAMHSNAVKTGATLSAMGTHINAVGVGVRNMGLKVFAAGAAIVGPMIYAARSFAETGARLYDLSRRTGIAVEELSALDYAASQTGASLEGVEIGLRIMSKSVLGAADAAEGTTGKLDHLGLSLKDLKGKSPIQQFNLIAERISAISDPTMRAAVALQMFGRSGTQLLPMLEKLDKLRGEAKEFGLIRTTESVRQAKAFSDAMTLMGRVIKSAWNAVGEAIVPVLQKAVKWITETVVKVRDWIKANPGLMESLLKIGAIVMGVGVGMAVLGMAIQTLAVPFAMLAGVVSFASTAFSVLVGVLGFVFSPIGAIIIAVGALSGVIISETGIIGKSLDWLGDKFSGLFDDAKSAFQGIKDALASGDIGLAAKIMWATLELWWKKGIFQLTNLWTAFRNGFVDMLVSLGPILLNIGGRLVDSMLAIGLAAAKALASGWLHGPAIDAMRLDAEKAKLAISENTGLGIDRIIEDVKAGRISKEAGTGYLKELQAKGTAARAGIDVQLAKSVADLTGNKVGEELKNIWAVPLPPLDTKKFTESLAGVNLTPGQNVELKKLQDAVDGANSALVSLVNTAASKAGKWGPRSTGGTGWPMLDDALKAAAAVPAVAGAAAGEEAKGGKFMGFEDVWKTLQSAVLGGDSDKKVQKDQLAVQRDMLKELKKPAGARAGA